MKRALSWAVLWPVVRFGFHVLTWAIPPVGFVLWRMRVSKRRHAEMLEATRTPGTREHAAASRIAGVA